MSFNVPRYNACNIKYNVDFIPIRRNIYCPKYLNLKIKITLFLILLCIRPYYTYLVNFLIKLLMEDSYVPYHIKHTMHCTE